MMQQAIMPAILLAVALWIQPAVSAEVAEQEADIYAVPTTGKILDVTYQPTFDEWWVKCREGGAIVVYSRNLETKKWSKVTFIPERTKQPAAEQAEAAQPQSPAGKPAVANDETPPPEEKAETLSEESVKSKPKEPAAKEESTEQKPTEKSPTEQAKPAVSDEPSDASQVKKPGIEVQREQPGPQVQPVPAKEPKKWWNPFDLLKGDDVSVPAWVPGRRIEPRRGKPGQPVAPVD